MRLVVRVLLVSAVLGGLLLAHSRAQSSSTWGFVVEIRGQATCQRAAEAPRRLEELAHLLSNDVVAVVGTSSVMVLDLARDEVLTVRGTYVVGAVPAGERSVVRAFVETLVDEVRRRLVASHDLRPPVDRSTPDAPRPISPRGRVSTAEPQFIWANVNDLTLTLWRQPDEDTALVKVHEEHLVGRTWSYDGPPLEPGVYRYSLTADGPVDTVAVRESNMIRFLVLTPEERQSIGSKLVELEPDLPSDAVQRHLQLHAFYLQDGIFLLDDAIRELEAAIDASPKDDQGRPRTASGPFLLTMLRNQLIELSERR